MIEKEMKALVIYNEGSNFSVGANIGLALFAANTAVWPMVEDMVVEGSEDLSQNEVCVLSRWSPPPPAWHSAAAARSA